MPLAFLLRLAFASVYPSLCLLFWHLHHRTLHLIKINIGSRIRASGSSETSSWEDILKPGLPRKPSWQLDYDQELAIPMPKPRQRRFNNPEKAPPLPEEPDEMKFPIMKKRAVTDPATAGQSASEPAVPVLTNKKSKMELIKNKLSFKDLRKESLKAEISSPIPMIVPDIPTRPLSEHARVHARRPLPGSGIPTMSPSISIDDLPAKLKPVQLDQALSIGLPTGVKSQFDIGTSRIPLPPSKTFSHPQGTVVPKTPIRSASQRTGGSVSGDATPSEKADITEKPVTDTEDTMSPSTGKSGLDIVVTGPSPETSNKQHELPSLPAPALNYGVTEDSIPKPLNLLVETDEVRCIAQDWVVEDTPSPTPLPKPTASTTHNEGETLQKANVQLDKLSSKEIQGPSTTVHIDDIVNMIQSIRQQTDMGMQTLDKRIDELTAWVNDQFNNAVDTMSDAAQANSELFAKHYQLSKELMKFQMDVRTEIGMMERRLNMSVAQFRDEMQTEMQAYSQVHDELTSKFDVCYEKLLSRPVEIQQLLEKMLCKQYDMEAKIEELNNNVNKVPQDIFALESKVAILEASIRNKNSSASADIGGAIADFDSKVSTPVSVKTIQPAANQERNDESASANTQAINTQPQTPAEKSEHGPISPVPSAHASLVHPRVRTGSQPKSPRIPRSLSLPRKAFLKNVKDATPTAPAKETDKEKSPEEPVFAEDGKKRNVFGFRRRRQVSDSAGSGSNKFNWSTSRRSSTANDGPSSRSSTPPVPAIPRLIPQWVDKTNTLSISHPAHRTASAQNKPTEGAAPATQKTPTATVTVQSSIARDYGSARGSMPASTSSSVGENKPASSSVISPGSFHSAEDKHASESTANNAVDDSARAPLLSDADQDWDQVSLDESHSRENLV